MEDMDKQTTKTIEISVPLSSSLLKAIDGCADQLCYSREEFITMACQQFIGQINPQALENIYCEKHIQQPEELQWAETGAILAGEILPKEEW